MGSLFNIYYCAAFAMYFHYSVHVIQKDVSQSLEITAFSLKIGCMKLLGNSFDIWDKDVAKPTYASTLYTFDLHIGYCYNQVLQMCFNTQIFHIKGRISLLTVLAMCVSLVLESYINLFFSFLFYLLGTGASIHTVSATVVAANIIAVHILGYIYWYSCK